MIVEAQRHVNLQCEIAVAVGNRHSVCKPLRPGLATRASAAPSWVPDNLQSTRRPIASG